VTAVTIRHRLWVAWDRLDLRWRTGSMLPWVRANRRLEERITEKVDTITLMLSDIRGMIEDGRE
jgi:hypothetical protein